MKSTISPERIPSVESAKTTTISKPFHDDRLFFIEFLRCFAIIQVILLHASAPFAASTSTKGLFWVGCILDSFARSCVPLFLLISGMLLLSSRRNESAIDFLKHRFWRVGIPLISWTIIYSGWRLSNGAQLDWVTVVNLPACYHLPAVRYISDTVNILAILSLLPPAQNSNFDRALIQCL